eukprot:14708297-Ditylum_brightwellii.AAC.1
METMVSSISLMVYSGCWLFSGIKDNRTTGTESTLPKIETLSLWVHNASVPRGHGSGIGSAIDGVDNAE